MSQKKTVRCRYGKCLHPNNREIPVDEAVKVGTTYYHPDCYQVKEGIKAVVDYYADNIEKNPIYGQLNGIVNKIVFNQGVSTDFLLFALKYSVEHDGIKIKHPPGLYYLVKDDEIQAAWMKQQQAKQRKLVSVNTQDTVFSYSGRKRKSFTDIIGGDTGGTK